MTSRSERAPLRIIAMRSMPKAMPPCGGAPKLSASRKNPYAAQLKKPVTIRLDQDSITYFKSMSEQTGIPYQSLINLYLKECASSGKKLNLAWK